MLAPFIVRACVAASAQGAHPSANDRLRLRTVRLAASTRRSTADLRAREAASRCLCRHRARSRGSGGGGKPGSSHLASVVGLGPGAASGTGGAAFAPSSFRGPSAVRGPPAGRREAACPRRGGQMEGEPRASPLDRTPATRRTWHSVPDSGPHSHAGRAQRTGPASPPVWTCARAHVRRARPQPPPPPPIGHAAGPPPHAPNAGSRHNDRAGARPARLLRGG
jgi:hypothetical protein